MRRLVVAVVLLASPALAQEPVPTLPMPDDYGPPPPPPPAAPPDPEPPAAPPPAEPTPEAVYPRYGARGSFQITNGFAIGASYTFFDTGVARRTNVFFDPGVDWFVVKNLALGIQSGITYRYARGYGADNSVVETEGTTIGGGLRFTGVLPLGERVSLAPRLTLGVASTHYTQTVLSGGANTVGNALGVPSSTSVGPWGAVYVPLLVHPFPHVVLGIGPSVNHVFARSLATPDTGGMATTWAVDGVVGIWWGGESPATDGRTSAAPRRRFGEAGELVIDGSFDLRFASTTYGGTPSSTTSFSLTPGIDYFAIDHVSIGVTAGLVISHSDSLAPSPSAGAPPVTVTADSTTVGIAPRVGVELPLGRWVSWYPRAALTVTAVSLSEKSNGAENAHKPTIVSGTVSAPLLVHVAEHAFVGFGPFVYEELSAKESDTTDYVRATQFGAQSLIGGWL